MIYQNQDRILEWKGYALASLKSVFKLMIMPHLNYDILTMFPVLAQPCFLSHTYKSWYSPPLSAYIITTVGPHFESECSQWSEPWLSCDDSGSGRTIYNLFTMETTVIVEMNLIFSDISCSIGWWVPVQCHWRLMCVHSSSQILNCVWS